ncbi:MAG TPA: DUF2891 domain-containing protein [bacterium]|nr:DUF2891 domain-containing protein [bacterium]
MGRFFCGIFIFVLAVGCGPAKKKEAEAAPPLPAGSCPVIDAQKAAELAALTLKCSDTEYPNKQCYLYEKEEDLKPTRLNNPAFYGCFDWHSAVHGHWTMAKLLKKFPDMPNAAAVRAKLNEHLTSEKIAVELAYFRSNPGRTFERTYGWAWLLRLAAELEGWSDPDAARWRDALKPLAAHIAEKTRDYLPRLSFPVRTGIHGNLAFSLNHMLDYARVVGDTELEKVIVSRSRELYLADTNCPVAYEPSGVDFVSPCLAEADLMRRILRQDDFAAWLTKFLPATASPDFRNLAAPPVVLDKKDYAIGHLIGLSLQRAWSFSGIAAVLPENDPRKAAYERLAGAHCERGFADMNDAGYGGEHWLASFAVGAALGF